MVLTAGTVKKYWADINPERSEIQPDAWVSELVGLLLARLAFPPRFKSYVLLCAIVLSSPWHIGAPIALDDLDSLHSELLAMQANTQKYVCMSLNQL